jgi:2-polyprenyl-6-methoxyphenol hydroxylase-like FAD-dependent oxidoreductase
MGEGDAGMRYDIIVAGGGLAGAALARALAAAGMEVLVLERETAFRDRVRGEQMHCWGVAEARALGIHDLLRESVGHEVRLWSARIAGFPEAPPRDMVETTPHRLPLLDFYHPAMQGALLGAAETAGAEVRRGAVVLGVVPGTRPAMRARLPDGEEATFEARLLVGADGRNSACRAWAGFEVRRDPERMVIAGALLDGFGGPEDRISLFANPDGGRLSFNAPLGGGRFRSYFGWWPPGGGNGRRRRLGGPRTLAEFAAGSIAAGAPAEWFEGAELAGPLASFEGADTWVPHPYRSGVALVGDAASSNDPCFGSGLSLALRDVRVLRDALLAGGDWSTAGDAYAAEHDRHYGAVHRVTGWLRTLLYDPGPEAAAIRVRALPLQAAEPARRIDHVGLGPDAPSDEAARRRFFGED